MKIAVIGLACRFPGGDDPQALWETLSNGRETAQELRSQRWDYAPFYSPDPRAANCSYAQTACLLRDIETFPGAHFQLSPKRLKHLDPQQRLMLELGREALIDAGLQARPFKREKTGVFIGASVSEYSRLMAQEIRTRQSRFRANGYTLPGGNLSMCASLLSQTFDLGGPAFTSDAACASTGAAVMQACHYLMSQPPGAVALAGGVYLLVSPENLVCFSKLGALSPRQGRPFDHRADGFVLGEGAGLLVLKRLEAAQQDRSYAVITGIGCSNDGRSNSPVTPSSSGQVRAMRSALQQAEVPPEEIALVECHGTGTPVGDRCEMESLATVFATLPRPRLGAVKASLGHSLSAALAAGLIKTCLSLSRRHWPAQVNFEQFPQDWPGTNGFDFGPFSWEGSRKALVNAFAFGGTNCSFVLESAPVLATKERPRKSWPFVITAPDAPTLSSHLDQLKPWLAVEGEELAQASYTLTVCRSRLAYLAAFEASEGEEVTSKLEELQRRLADAPETFRDAQHLPQPDYPPWAARPCTLPSCPLPRRSYWAFS